MVDVSTLLRKCLDHVAAMGMYLTFVIFMQGFAFLGFAFKFRLT